MWGNQSVGDARTTYDSAFSFMLFRMLYTDKNIRNIYNAAGETKTFCVGNNANAPNWQMKIVVSTTHRHAHVVPMDGPLWGG